MHSNRVTSEKKPIHPPPLPSPPLSSIQSRGVCCFILVAQTEKQHCMKGMVGGGGASFSPFNFGKTSESPIKAEILN